MGLVIIGKKKLLRIFFSSYFVFLNYIVYRGKEKGQLAVALFSDEAVYDAGRTSLSTGRGSGLVVAGLEAGFVAGLVVVAPWGRCRPPVMCLICTS